VEVLSDDDDEDGGDDLQIVEQEGNSIFMLDYLTYFIRLAKFHFKKK